MDDRVAVQATANAPQQSQSMRVEWLDGVRACAAVYVMLHHIYIHVFPGFPVNTGPWYLGWLMYGQLAVVVFIVVSGFSLSLGPVRNDCKLAGGASTFFSRRAWRILPPYWVALAFSMIIDHFFVPEIPGQEVTLRSLVVNGVLLQNIIRNHTPNGAFWSIAVEAQIYILFPMLLLLGRRYSMLAMAVVVTFFVCAAHWLSTHIHALDKIDHLTPQLLVGFALGMVVAGAQIAASASWRSLRRWLPLLAAALAAGFVATCAMIGFVEVDAHYFWIDLAAAFVVTVAFFDFVLSSSTFAWLLRARPLRACGKFSYSLYLIHGPLMALFLTYFAPFCSSRSELFLMMIFVAAPTTLGLSYLFFLLFEQPFLTIRSWAEFQAVFFKWLPVSKTSSP